MSKPNDGFTQIDTIKYNGSSIGNCAKYISYSFSDKKTSKFEYNQDVLNLGSNYDTLYISLLIQNNSKEDSFFVKLNNSTIDFIECSYLDNSNLEVVRSGMSIPFNKRPYSDHKYIFPIKINPTLTKQIDFKIRTNKKILFPIEISSLSSIEHKEKRKDNFLNLYFGIFLAISIFNLILFSTIKNEQYGYFAVFVFFSGLIQLIILGYGDKYLFPNNSWLGLHSIQFFACINGVFTLLFFNSLLDFKKASKFLYNFYRIELIGFVLIFSLSFIPAFLPYSYNLINIFSIPAIILILSSLKGVFQKQGVAKQVLAAMIILIISMMVFIMKEYSILPYNNFTNYTLPVGKTIMFFVLAIAVSNNYKILKLQKDEATRVSYEALEQNQTLIRNQKKNLEQKVIVRTRELEDSKQELEVALSQLEHTQNSRIEAEKMSSLGQLTAGIAHELNNPINFIANNVSPLRRDMSEILTLVDKYESCIDHSVESEKLTELNDYKEEIEVDYLKKEIDVLLSGIYEGSSRTAEIVQNLKIYSHLDSGKKQQASIIPGLKSTIVILQSNFKTDCKVDSDIPDNISNIFCLPGKLNQVFMNILNNAIHASIDKHKMYSDREVSVACKQDDKNIYVSIKDNGNGIPDKVLAKIFDPFFTTKKVGLGTGLGLSISKTIIESHQGEIKINTSIGNGTEFVVILPLVFKEE